MTDIASGNVIWVDRVWRPADGLQARIYTRPAAAGATANGAVMVDVHGGA